MFFSVLVTLFYLTLAHAAAPPGSLTELRHARAHSYSDDYAFSPEDGWTTLTASDEPYKYPNDTQAASHAKAFPSKDHASPKNHASRGLLSRGLEKISTSLKSIMKGLHGMGQPQDVVVTWCVYSSLYELVGLTVRI